jgi:hypothetical protein
MVSCVNCGRGIRALTGMVLFADDFGLGHFVAHFDDGAHDGFHHGVFAGIKVFKAATLGAVGDLDGDAVAVRGGGDQFIGPAHELHGVHCLTLGGAGFCHGEIGLGIVRMGS